MGYRHNICVRNQPIIGTDYAALRHAIKITLRRLPMKNRKCAKSATIGPHHCPKSLQLIALR